MDRADKAVLRLAIGLGLAVVIAYGFALPLPFVACVLTVVLLSKPGPPIPFVKGAVFALVVAAVLVAGVLMVPILKHYAVTGVLLTCSATTSVSPGQRSLAAKERAGPVPS